LKVFLDLVYLNTVTDEKRRILYENLYIEILSTHKPYTDALVLDELIYVSKKKYGIPYRVTIEFIDTIILPYTALIPLGEEEYREAARILERYNIKPSDALHIAAMKTHNIRIIISEDKELDKIPGIERKWPLPPTT